MGAFFKAQGKMVDQPEVKSETAKENKPKQIAVAVQRTFHFKAKGIIFKKAPTPEEMDAIINPWLKDMALRGTPAQLGKYLTNGRTGDVYHLYLYTERITI